MIRYFKETTVRMASRVAGCAVLMLVFVSYAHAQMAMQPPPHLESLDLLLMNSESVVVGTVAEFRLGGASAPQLTINVKETLKGAASARMQVAVPRNLDSVKSDSDLLLIATGGRPRARGQAAGVATVLNLSRPDLAVMTADLRLLRTAGAVLAEAREILRHSSIVRSPETFGIPVDARRVAGTKLDNRRNNAGRQNFVTLDVPVDDRLEWFAREAIRSTDPDVRISGANALRYFRSDANIALLRSLLDDPQNNVRQAANATLRALAVDLPQPTTPSPARSPGAVSPGASAQTGFSRWRVTEIGLSSRGTVPARQEVTMELKNENGAVTGFVVRGAQRVPLEGRATAASIGFTARLPNNRGTVIFVGTLNGDEILFIREAHDTGDGTGIFGENGPATLIVKRAN